MAFTIDSIKKGAVLKAPRIVLLGVHKIGKSAFACGTRFGPNGTILEEGINSPVLIPIKGEEGIDEIDVPKFPECDTFEKVLDAIEVLCKDKHDHHTIVIDSASSLEPLIWDAVCQDHGVDNIELVMKGYNKGYAAACSKWRELQDALNSLRDDKGMASIIVGHTKIKRFDDPTGESYDQYQFDVRSDVSALLFRRADLILFCNTKVIVKKEDVGFKQEKKRGIDITGGQRFLYTQGRPAHPGGGRGSFGRLPYELPLEWEKFEEAVAKVAKQKEEAKKS